MQDAPNSSDPNAQDVRPLRCPASSARFGQCGLTEGHDGTNHANGFGSWPTVDPRRFPVSIVMVGARLAEPTEGGVPVPSVYEHATRLVPVFEARTEWMAIGEMGFYYFQPQHVTARGWTVHVVGPGLIESVVVQHEIVFVGSGPVAFGTCILKPRDPVMVTVRAIGQTLEEASPRMNTPGMDRYRAGLARLLADRDRAGDCLPDDEESTRVAELDRLWFAMTSEEQDAIESRDGRHGERS